MERIQTYYNASQNTTLPNHILFYRDGVSESQYGMVYAEEIPQIRQCITTIKAMPATKEKFRGWQPKITLLIVGKRHNARFYQRPTRKANLDAGMVVDHTVVAPTPQNFYLQSHDSPLGTARNGHYVVIINESGYTDMELQDIVCKDSVFLF